MDHIHNSNYSDSHYQQEDLYEEDDPEDIYNLPYEALDYIERVQEEQKDGYPVELDDSDFQDDEEPYHMGSNIIHQNGDQAETYEELLALDATIVKVGLTKNQLDNFSTRTFLANTNSNTCCSVCLEDFELGDTLKKIKCKHEFP